MSRRVEVPESWRTALRELFGEQVDDVRVFERARRLAVHGRAVATTRRGRIYLRGTAQEFFCDPALVLHEYFHVVRQWRPGQLTILRYLAELLRRGYWDNRFEVEAREFVEDNLYRFRALLSRCNALEAADTRSEAEGPRRINLKPPAK